MNSLHSRFPNMVYLQASSPVRWEVDYVVHAFHTLVSSIAIALLGYATHLWDTSTVYVMKSALKSCHCLYNSLYNLCQPVEIMSAGIGAPR